MQVFSAVAKAKVTRLETVKYQQPMAAAKNVGQLKVTSRVKSTAGHYLTGVDMDNYTGKFLIARPHLDGVFKQTIIYLYEDGPAGTSGLILNKPTGQEMRDLLATHGIPYPSKIDPIYLGGPVASNSVMMLHTDEFRSSNTLFTPNGLCISSDDLMIQKIVNGDRPKAFKTLRGRSQWAPGQLAHEIKNNSWLVTELPKNIVFDFGNNNTWQQSIEIAGQQMFKNYI